MFEAVLLAAFSSRIDPAGLVAAMLLYRLFYVVLPLVAAGLLLLAQGLRRRLSAAWALTLVLSLLKDFDWPEALAAIAGLLALFRREFYRRSRLMDVPASGLVLAATAGVIAASVWLLLFAYQDVAYSHQLWWQFELDANAPRGLRAALGSALVLLAVGLTWLLRATPPSIRLPDEEALLRARAIVLASRQPEGGLALSGGKALLFHPDGEPFLIYARRRRSLVAMFDPIGPAAARAELI